MGKEIIQNKKNEKKVSSPLFSIYGARESKDGTRINLTIVTGKDDKKTYATISIKKDSGKVVVKDGNVWVKVNMLKDLSKKEQATKPDDLPF